MMSKQQQTDRNTSNFIAVTVRWPKSIVDRVDRLATRDMPYLSRNKRLLKITEDYLLSKEQEEGRADENFSPVRAHFDSGGCREYNRMKQRRNESQKTADTIRATTDTINMTISRKRDIDSKLREGILSLISLNARYGADLLCSSSEEWNQKYDGGRKDATEICAVSTTTGIGIGTSSRKELVVREFSTDAAGFSYMKPEQVTRKIDDIFQSLRELHPDIMAEVDKNLSIANRRMLAQ